MKKTILILGIIFLLISVSVASSTVNRVKETPSNYNQIETMEVLKYVKSDERIAYAYILYAGSSGEPFGPCYFQLDDPGNITSYYCGKNSPPSITGGTWTNDGRWLCCDDIGIIWEIDPEDGSITPIGGGGGSHYWYTGLAYNPVNKKLYEVYYDTLYEIDINNGSQTYIGDFGSGPDWMIGIAFDAEGILYGWDIGTDNLWTINIRTANATLVGPLGIDIIYAQDGAFDYEYDILYLSAYTESPSYGGHLYVCNEDTGSCFLIGPFEGYAEIDGLAIPYNWTGPTADFLWTPLLAEPYIPVNFDASDSYDPDGYITLYEWDWDNDGIYDENHTSPKVTHIWDDKGEFPVTLRVTDNDGFIGLKTKTVRVGNQPPDAPIITGLSSGKPGTLYDFTLNSVDPDGDDVRYHIDWGDNTSDITGYASSGINVTIYSGWDLAGKYTIIARANDVYGAISNETIFNITIKKNKSIQNTLFLRFLDHFPLLHRLLDIWRCNLL